MPTTSANLGIYPKPDKPELKDKTRPKSYSIFGCLADLQRILSFRAQSRNPFLVIHRHTLYTRASV